jgi:hypothetical protein
MNTVDIESEDQAEIEGEAGQRLRERLPVRLTLRGDLSDIGNVLLALRALGGFDSGPMRYPIYRLVRAAARRPLDELFDDLAQHAGLAAPRLGEGSLLLDGPGELVSTRGRRKTDYSSMTFAIWADSLVSLESIRDWLLGVVGNQRLREETFTVDWHFAAGELGLTSVRTKPTRLSASRSIAKVLYTADTRALERAEVERLLARLCGSDPVLLGRAIAAALPDETRSTTLASIYRAEGAVRAAATEAGRATRLAGTAAN